ncbi:uncharacterized protein DS421_13g435160 [Arachis hypogaea]|nr:uncharacterized protein DS421_13g435160 [Arachis hypogaea]
MLRKITLKVEDLSRYFADNSNPPTRMRITLILLLTYNFNANAYRLSSFR